MSAIDKARASLHGSLAWGAFTQAQKSLTTPAGQAQARFVQEQSKAFVDALPANHDCGIKQLAQALNADARSLTPAAEKATTLVAEDFQHLATAAGQAGLLLEPRNLSPN
jgi:hypothetical protein